MLLEMRSESVVVFRAMTGRVGECEQTSKKKIAPLPSGRRHSDVLHSPPHTLTFTLHLTSSSHTSSLPPVQFFFFSLSFFMALLVRVHFSSRAMRHLSHIVVHLLRVV